jgi:DNA polymerase I-like protein with 3'-5' exonuclease and polymerase domains
MGYLEDQLKTAAATWGQQPVAHHIKLAHLNAASHPDLTPVLTVHDELLCEVDERTSKRRAKEALRECMEIESPEMPGFGLLSEVVWGRNWAEKNEC